MYKNDKTINMIYIYLHSLYLDKETSKLMSAV